jgi:PmbA protein
VVLLSGAAPLPVPRVHPVALIGQTPGDHHTMNHLDRLSDLIAHARAAGADAADALLVAGTSLSVTRRLGKTEHVERSEGQDLGLRVFIGKQAAIVSATSIDPAGFAGLAERAVAMAKVVPEDPYAGLADTAAPPESSQYLDMEDPSEPSAEDLIARAAAAEDAALAVPGVTNSEGADAGFSRGEIYLVTSAGFAGHRVGTSHSISATALVGEGTGMQRDYDYDSKVYLADLDDPAAIGRSAANRALARLNPTRPKTGKLPVVYDPRVATSLLGSLMGAINGASVARGTSFLKQKLGQKIFASGIFVHDDPRRVRGPRSRVFDGEGTPTKARALIEDGVLTTWLLDSRSARQLGMVSTGHAARSTSGPPSPSASNLWLAAGTVTPAELMADIKLGLYITEMMGGGVNGVTGDYSRGAAGFMIRDGKLAEAVAEITVAGHALEMFATMTPANDLVFRRGTDSPTVRVEGLTMAGA